ncbi:antitoxin [Paramicrobacterium chengjingii]|uniref:Antitoxin n=1 Tax=Paramicrobacterium chengjingii TaxID=2769067 RepID=A0ABX6YK79_9MICO|nr:antitoxin [Microbacterium chengjingii]QPZ39168.1 antitoxin [Microbacterium chengjingii]
MRSRVAYGLAHVAPSNKEDVVGLDDITNKAKEFLNDNKVKEALNSEQAEGISDKLLDGVADAANKVTGGKFDSKIDDARNAADEKIGDE